MDVTPVSSRTAPETLLRSPHWAALVHDLRNATPYIRWTTALPWPLQLAKQIADYML
ncbi:RNaseH domain-containing protein [Micromonospora sp. LOL_024]|uniref:RNaseH domain-containing protein n=1 Tax=Micromonospora sp. LOL_024 TaxID=3345412 RepID=UPI003A8683B6